ncbi:Cys-Gln thioester bond-forming surface protein [Streptomyces sp. NPDC002851]
MRSRPKGNSVLSSFSVRRRGAARLAVTALVSGLVACGAVFGAGAAAADEPPQHQGGASATLGGLKTYDQAVIRQQGEERQIPAGLFEMAVDDGGMLQTYCIDIHNPTQKDAKYGEVPWSSTSLNSNHEAGKINWILQNSYPQVNDLALLAKKAGADSLTEEAAAAGTQVAIWRFSDHADVEAVDPQAEKLADYLQQRARDLAEPRASLTLEPPAVSGKPGERLGPVTVRTNGERVVVSPPADAAATGARVVDKKGEPVTSAANGSELYFDVPEGAADGSAELIVQTSTTVPVGRAFASETNSQTQILAGSSESTVSATASANWAKKGAIPALSAQRNCAKGGVDITAANKGDEPFTFRLMGFKHTIEAGESRTVTIPLQEDQAYDFTITGPGGFEERFHGVLDCRTAGSVDGQSAQGPAEPSPASAGGDSGTQGAGDLAATGSSSATPIIAGIAIALLVIGGLAVFLLRKKTTETTETDESGD